MAILWLDYVQNVWETCIIYPPRKHQNALQFMPLWFYPRDEGGTQLSFWYRCADQTEGLGNGPLANLRPIQNFVVMWTKFWPDLRLWNLTLCYFFFICLLFLRLWSIKFLEIPVSHFWGNVPPPPPRRTILLTH